MANLYNAKCTECGTEQPIDIVSEDKWNGNVYPPNIVEAVCAERWGGCGKRQRMKVMWEE